MPKAIGIGHELDMTHDDRSIGGRAWRSADDGPTGRERGHGVTWIGRIFLGVGNGDDMI